MFSTLHIELTSRCNKNSCWMCGRRKMEREYPHLVDWGDMPHEMVHKIAMQVPRGSVVQLHNNGEPTLYPYLGWALFQFKHCFRQFNTNGKLLVEKAGEVIGNLDVLTISVIENDVEGGFQYDRVREFIKLKGESRPSLVFRLLGKVERPDRWKELGGVVVTRVLHDPSGSYDYQKPVTIPEIGVCLDLMTHLAVDRYGNISLCVRFDPDGKLRLGNVNDTTLFDAWNGQKRAKYIEKHIEQKRDELAGCQRCEYWGVARGE